MELWVRNMWKHGLYKVDGVVAREVNGKWEITDLRSVLPLGEYATKERCLEILDEIQKLLNSGNAENAFMIFQANDFCMTKEEFDYMVWHARQEKAIMISGCSDIQFVQPNVLTYNMPEK